MENDSPESKDTGKAALDKISDMVKKVLTVGTTAAFMTEESIRAYLADVKLPKEILHLIVQGANKSKEEVMNRVSKEMISILNKIDFVKEASRFVEEHKFKITAEVEVLKKNPAKTKEETDSGSE
jgi:hypothetical protein